MENNEWNYPEKGQYPKTSDGLVICETINGNTMKLLYFYRHGRHIFYDGGSLFVKVLRWKLI